MAWKKQFCEELFLYLKMVYYMLLWIYLYTVSVLSLHILLPGYWVQTSYPKPPMADRYLHHMKRWYLWEFCTGLRFSSVPQWAALDSKPNHQIGSSSR